MKKLAFLMLLASFAGVVPGVAMADDEISAQAGVADAAPTAAAMTTEDVLNKVAGVYTTTRPDWSAKLQAMASGAEAPDAGVLTTVAADLRAQGRADWAEKVESIAKAWEATQV